jgi:ComF family protein
VESTIISWLATRRRRLAWPRRALDALFESRCLFCRQSADVPGVDLCGYCLEALPRDAAPRAGATGLRSFCAFAYRPPVDGQVREFKFRGDLAAGRVLGTLLAALRATAAADLPDLLIPVPLHASRRAERGFDQAARLAMHAGEWLGLPVERRLLRRLRATASQSSLAPAARRRNVAGAFAVDPRALARLGAPGPRVALVDDVLTTGATFAAASRALREAGLREIECWAVARAGADGAGAAGPLASSDFLTPGGGAGDARRGPGHESTPFART